MEKFDWDPKKAQRNQIDHHVSFEEAATAFDDDFFLVFQDARHSRGERRYLLPGRSNAGRVLVKKKSVPTLADEDMLPHYDFKKMPIIARGPGYRRGAKPVRMTRVTLDPDIQPFFPDDQAVNEALRTLIRLVGVRKKPTARTRKQPLHQR
jgi:hypothetical protein